MGKTAERRTVQREALIDAAERSIAASGLAGLKTRELARTIGVANGAVYNLISDIDELILLVSSRTLRRLDAALNAGAGDIRSPTDDLVRISRAYCDFAIENPELLRSLFEHRMAAGKTVPDWAAAEQMGVFRHVLQPLQALFPKASREEIGLTARCVFSAVHGIIALGLDEKLVAVPQSLLRDQVAIMVRAIVAGLKDSPPGKGLPRA